MYKYPKWLNALAWFLLAMPVIGALIANYGMSSAGYLVMALGFAALWGLVLWQRGVNTYGRYEMTKHEKMLLEIAKAHHQELSHDRFNSWLFGFYKIQPDISDKLKQELKQLKETASGGT